MIVFDRICYKNGNPKNQPIYEFHAYCDCAGCKFRYNYLKQPRNQATATTENEKKISELKQFLNLWKCKGGNKQLKTEYFKF